MERPKRVRRRNPELQLQVALNQAEELSLRPTTPDTVELARLIKTRLNVLKSRVTQKLKAEVADLRIENERLKRQHEQDTVELARLRVACHVPDRTGLSFEEIAQGAHGGQNARNV